MQTTRYTKLSIAGLAGLLLGACASADVETREEPTTREHLAAAWPTFAVDRDGSQVTLGARLNRDSHWEESEVVLDVTGGHATLGADGAGHVVLDELELSFADIIVGEQSLPGGGIHLTDLRARLNEPARATLSKWSPDEQSFYAEVEVTVTVEWSLVVDGTAYALGPQELNPIPMDLTVHPGAGLVLDFAVTSEGVLWEHQAGAELHDLQIVARGYELTVE